MLPPDPRKYLWDAASAAEQARDFAGGLPSIPDLPRIVAFRKHLDPRIRHLNR